MRVAALIVAAGRGARVGGEIPKQFMTLHGQPVLAWSVRMFTKARMDVVVAVAPEHAEFYRATLKDFPGVRVVAGGRTRTASVRAGLDAIEQAEVVLIHDAARPGVSDPIVQQLLHELEAGVDGVAPAVPVADSLRRADAAGNVIGEVARDALMRVQTPQAFRAEPLRAAYAALPEDAALTDDLAVVRAHGGSCRLVPGDERLMKITYPEDFAFMERLLASERETCVGSGFDAHRFGAGDHVTLCGVRIAHDKGLAGHSDADAGWHALVDAILGALGDGDIGAHFPPSDPQWKGADSERFLQHAVRLVSGAGARIVHVDVTLICERPKIGPHRDAMRERTAAVLGLPIARVSVKATTTERMGFVGREEGLAAQATATLVRPV